MTDQDQSQLRRLGVPAHQVEAAKRQRTAQHPAAILVATHLWPAVTLFNALQTQWVLVAGMGGLLFVGLNYLSIQPTMELLELGVAHRKRLFAYLQIMEDEAKKVLNQEGAA